MNRFLVVGFEFRESRYHSLILCKAKDGEAEYRITVMHGDIEKQLCNDNIIREENGYLHFERSGNELQNQVKTEIAIALGNRIGKPVKKCSEGR